MSTNSSYDIKKKLIELQNEMLKTEPSQPQQQPQQEKILQNQMSPLDNTNDILKQIVTLQEKILYVLNEINKKTR